MNELIVGLIVVGLIACAYWAHRSASDVRHLAKDVIELMSAQQSDLLDRVQSPDLPGYTQRRRFAGAEEDAKVRRSRPFEPAVPLDPVQQFIKDKPWESHPSYAGKAISVMTAAGIVGVHDPDNFEYREIELPYFMADVLGDREIAREDPDFLSE